MRSRPGTTSPSSPRPWLGSGAQCAVPGWTPAPPAAGDCAPQQASKSAPWAAAPKPVSGPANARAGRHAGAGALPPPGLSAREGFNGPSALAVFQRCLRAVLDQLETDLGAFVEETFALRDAEITVRVRLLRHGPAELIETIGGLRLQREFGSGKVCRQLIEGARANDGSRDAWPVHQPRQRHLRRGRVMGLRDLANRLDNLRSGVEGTRHMAVGQQRHVGRGDTGAVDFMDRTAKRLKPGTKMVLRFDAKDRDAA